MINKLKLLLPFLIVCLYLPLTITGSLTYAFENKLDLNQSLKEVYGIEVYGDHTLVPDNDFKEVLNGYYNKDGTQGEFRFHGYDQNMNPYTNIHFPNDATSMRALSTKNWLYKGWEHFNLNSPHINTMAINASTKEEKLLQSWIRSSLPFPLSNGTNKEKLNNIEEYLYIQTQATSLTHGEGRLWHQVNGKTYYQTFSLPPMDKLSPDAICHVEILNKNEISPQSGQHTITLDVKVTGTLTDHTSPIHYSKEDLKGFYLSLDDTTLFIPLKTADKSHHTFAVKVPKPLLENTEKRFTGKAIAVYKDMKTSRVAYDYDTLSLSQETASLLSNLNIQSQSLDTLSKGFNYSDASIGLYNTLHLILKEEGQVICEKTVENNSSKDDSINRWLSETLKVPGQYSLLQTVKNKMEEDTTFKQFKIVEGNANIIDINLEIPDYIFDNTPLIIIDKTDQKNIKEINATIDGLALDHTKPYSFKETDHNHIHKLSFSYLSNTGHLSSYETWLEVLTTQPRVQGKLEGTFKEGLPLSIKNTSMSINDDRLLEKYPMTYSYKLDGISWPYEDAIIQNPHEHTLEITGTNTLGKSTSHTLTFYTQKDIEADILFNIWNPVLSRKDPLSYVLEVNSVDGDTIERIDYELTDPTGNSQRIDSIDDINFTQLGGHTLKVIAYENTGTRKEIERNLTIENIRPTTQSIFNSDTLKDSHHLVLMVDEAIEQTTHDTLLSQAIEIENHLKLQGLDIEVDVVSLKNYSKEVYTETGHYTGTTIPRPNLDYVSGPYAGTLALINHTDLGQNKDLGRYRETTTCTTVFQEGGWDCSGLTSMDCQDNNCNRWTMTYSSHLKCCGCKREMFLDTVCKTKKIWIPNITWISNYYGTYAGTVQMTFKQMMPEISLSDHLTTIYISDSNKLPPDIASTLGNIDYLIPYKELDQTLDLLTHSKKETKKVLINTPFSLFYIDSDRDGDDTKELSKEIAFDPVFDNPLPYEAHDTTFKTPGHYTIKRQIIDASSHPKASNLDVLDILAHRPPIAKLDISWDYDYESNMYIIDWIDHSFDPDYEKSREDKGIRSRHVKLREEGDFFTYTLPRTLSSGTYELYYSVKDIDGAMSKTVAYTLSLPDTPPPKLFATFSQGPFEIGDEIIVTDIKTRYALPLNVLLKTDAGDFTLANLRSDGVYQLWQDQNFILPNLADGTYKIELFATDQTTPQIKDVITHSFKVETPINLHVKDTMTYIEGDTITLSCETSKHVNSVKVSLEHNMQTISVDLKREGEQWTGKLNTLPVGEYTLQYQATIDTVPKKSEKKVQKLNIMPLSLYDISITGNWHIWDGDQDASGIYRSNMPHRFLALETVDITGITNSQNYTITIDGSEAFKTSASDTFDYSKTFESPYPFPSVHTFNNSSFSIQFPLPLAMSTLSLDNERLKEPYTLYITIKSGDVEKTYSIDDIDITSNIYDFTYIQSK